MKYKKAALSKSWYAYYSFKNPTTGKLERQTSIKAGVNRYKDKKSRIHILSKLKESLEYVLSKGFNPYEDNSSLAAFIEQLLSPEKSEPKKKPTQKETPPLSLEKEVIKNKPLLYPRIF